MDDFPFDEDYDVGPRMKTTSAASMTTAMSRNPAVATNHGWIIFQIFFLS